VIRSALGHPEDTGLKRPQEYWREYLYLEVNAYGVRHMNLPQKCATTTYFFIENYVVVAVNLLSG